MKTKFRVFTALLLALMVLVSVLPLQAAAEIGQSGTATRAEAENTAEAALSVKPMLTPSYTPSASYRSGKYYTQLCNVSLTGNQRTDLVNVARSQLGYHEGDNTSQLHGESSGSSNYTEYGYWYGTQVQGHSGGSYYAWCAYFISWCARQAGIPTSIISNASYACAGSDNGDFKNLDFYNRGSYTPKVGDLVFFDWPGDEYHWDHVEIVIGVSSSEVTTLGGNTGDNNVKSRKWSLSNSNIRGYGVPKYTTGSTPSPDPTPTPAPSGGVQDLTNPKNPNKYSTPPSGTYLNVGDSGNYVRWLQACLNQCGYSCDVDGQFGYGTAEALKGFQRAYSLTVDGGFGPECRTKILEVLTVAAPTITTAYDANGTRVTISGSSGTTIFYTTNGSTPTESSNKYNGSFVLNGAATVKAVAMQNCRYNSYVSSYGITVTKHTVTFKDWNGTVLKTQSVYHTGAATAPANPTRTGYTFTGWDKAFTNVTADLVVTAQYSINTYTVTFKDWNGTVLKTQQVQYGGAATAPANPTRTGYTFTGWDKAFTNVTANLVVTAQYSINSYTVTFKDWNGTVLKTQQVQYGGAATAPANPTRAGYTFTGWDKAFTNVTANLVVTAQYSINTYTVTFKDWNGTVLKTQQVQYGGAATAPANPTRTGYTFTGWDKAFTNVTANLVVTAQYVQNEPVSTPVPSDAPQIVVESKTTSAGSTVAVNISIANNPGIVSMTLHVNFDSRLELVSVQDTGLLPGKVHSTVMLNPYTLAWENDSATQNYTVNGTLVTLTFNVPENLEEGDYAVSVSYDSEGYEIYDFNAEPVDFAVVNGKISVTDIIYGDVNGDGKVNNLDRLILTRYLANWPDYPASRIKPGADTNADGKINNLDRLILTRHLANWPDYATLPWSSGKSNASVVGAESGTKDNEPKIIVNGVEAAPGDTVSVGIEIANNPGIISMTLDVAFDPALTLLRVEDTGLLPGTVPCTVMQNPFTLVWTNDSASENFYVNGTLTYFVFKVADNAEPGAYNITVTYNLDEYDIYDCNAEPVEFAVQNGAVTVAAAQPEMHTVTFKDWDGTVLKTQEVQHGGDAEAPADPTRTGYTFTGWDKAFTNITADLVVTAQYEINTYTVTFKDWDGTVLKTQEVQYGGDAEAPADPTRVGYTFTGWDKAFTNVTADLVVTAQYEINTYTVTFKDWDGTVLKTQEVQYGGNAEAPADPTRTGYTFTGWDKAFTNIKADLVVTAQYEINTYTVTFKDWDGTVLKTQEVQYGGDAEAPADPTRVGYTFTGWDKAFTNITADLVVTAQYEMLGDVDGDGNVSMADALTILRMAMDILPVENQQIADVDGDGFITSMDALLALRFAMHIEQ